MDRRTTPLEDVVTPCGSAGGVALWQKVRSFMLAGTESGTEEFGLLAIEVFRHQFKSNPVYRRWCGHLGWTEKRARDMAHWRDIPCMPVESFRWETIRTSDIAEASGPIVFRTSGTTGSHRGEHHVHTPGLYQLSAVQGFQSNFGPPSDDGAVVFGLLPGYLERADSSLVHMVGMLRKVGWCEAGGAPEDGFFLADLERLFAAVAAAVAASRPVVLIGVTWAMVDAAEAWRNSGRPALGEAVQVMVTGGMKGRREEWVSERVRQVLSAGFGLSRVGGEYGMTEMLSQAWSMDNGLYQAPHWMRVRIRRTDDPFVEASDGSTGGVDVVDLANLGSCSFLSTQDLGRTVQCCYEPSRTFEILGRFDDAEVRGCNLLIE